MGLHISQDGERRHTLEVRKLEDKKSRKKACSPHVLDVLVNLLQITQVSTKKRGFREIK